LIVKKRQQIGKKPLDEVWFIVCKCAQSQDSSSPNMLHVQSKNQQQYVDTKQNANKPKIIQKKIVIAIDLEINV